MSHKHLNIYFYSAIDWTHTENDYANSFHQFTQSTTILDGHFNSNTKYCQVKVNGTLKCRWFECDRLKVNANKWFRILVSVEVTTRKTRLFGDRADIASVEEYILDILRSFVVELLRVSVLCSLAIETMTWLTYGNGQLPRCNGNTIDYNSCATSSATCSWCDDAKCNHSQSSERI